MLIIKNVSFNYDNVPVLHDISLTLEDNKIYGLIGKNGIGKTTFLKVISRFINTNNGEIYINESSITNKDFLNTCITYVLDECIYFNELTLVEHLSLMGKVTNQNKEECIKFINTFIDELDLNKYKDHYPSTLSRGTLQRLNIGMGLIKQSPYLLMDEPFNGLDPVQIKKCLNYIVKYKQRLNNTILISSHQLDYLKNICDDYLIMTSEGIYKVNKNHINEREIIEILRNDTVN